MRWGIAPMVPRETAGEGKGGKKKGEEEREMKGGESERRREQRGRKGGWRAGEV